MRKVLILLIPLGFAQEPHLHLDDECAEDRTDCALTALQHRGVLTQKMDCHTAVQGEGCFDEVTWAREVGLRTHPDWYPGLTANSSVADFQFLIHDQVPGKCPIPCGALPPLPRPKRPLADGLVAPTDEGGSVTIKVLSYNLFWWNLYGVRGGNGESAGHLIKSETVEDGLFDVMGFQECENGIRVLEPVGLMDRYEVLQGMHAVCLAYRKDAWKLLSRGSKDVGEDMKSHYYGHRGVVWMLAAPCIFYECQEDLKKLLDISVEHKGQQIVVVGDTSVASPQQLTFCWATRSTSLQGALELVGRSSQDLKLVPKSFKFPDSKNINHASGSTNIARGTKRGSSSSSRSGSNRSSSSMDFSPSIHSQNMHYNQTPHIQKPG